MEAVGGGEDPVLVDEGSSADMNVVLTPPWADLQGMEGWRDGPRVSILGHCRASQREFDVFQSLWSGV